MTATAGIQPATAAQATSGAHFLPDMPDWESGEGLRDIKTPVSDFVDRYCNINPVRMHMPGHKGHPVTGPEPWDLTEVEGADVLYAETGILRESQENATALFGSARTVYSTEGSSLCIRAMGMLTLLHAKSLGRRPLIAAGRNAHRVFLQTAAVLDLDIEWLGLLEPTTEPEYAGCLTEDNPDQVNDSRGVGTSEHGKKRITDSSLLSCEIEPEELEALFQHPETAPTAVYVTTPDYLGNQTPLRPLAELCHRYGALLLVDNAHGAYLRFLPNGGHPLTQEADFCCDSAHKTLPVLTGGAYLHAGSSAPEALVSQMPRAMAMFASTSPSWLILRSLDAANKLLAEDYPKRIRKTCEEVSRLKASLSAAGWTLTGTEPMKLTLYPKPRGYTGVTLAGTLARCGIVCEFADPDYLVLMPSAETTSEDFRKLEQVLNLLPIRPPITEEPPQAGKPETVVSVREAMLSPSERVPSGDSAGRILASPCVQCPPAVPILICGERIRPEDIERFRYYGIDEVDVLL